MRSIVKFRSTFWECMDTWVFTHCKVQQELIINQTYHLDHQGIERKMFFTKVWNGVGKLLINGFLNNVCHFFHKTMGVLHCGLAIYNIIRKKKIYQNSNNPPCKNIICKKSSNRNQNPSRYNNYIINLKFQHKPKYRLSKFLI